MIYGMTTFSLEKWREIARLSGTPKQMEQLSRSIVSVHIGAGMKKLICMMLGLMATGLAVAKLPPLSAEAAAKAAEDKAKAAWSSKVAAYKLCLAQDKVAARYRLEKNASAQPVGELAACSDPGPYVAANPVAANPVAESALAMPAAPAGSPVATGSAATVKK